MKPVPPSLAPALALASVARVAAAVVLMAAAMALAGCDGTTSTGHQHIAGRRLTIYTSLPLTGPSGASGRATLDGARMALAAAHGRVGRYTIGLRSLNDATVASKGWDPGQTTANARLAIRDTTTIGYLGDLNSGATAVSIPVLNRARLPQVSPLSTAVGLTHGGGEAAPGEPQKYYPTNHRTFARVIPSDIVQSAVQVSLQRQAGCKRVYLLYDNQVDGRDPATSFQAAAERAGLHILGYTQFDPTAKNYTALSTRLSVLAPDCVLISALTQDNAVAVTDAVGRALPRTQLFATAPLAEDSYVDPAAGGVSEALDPRLTITSATLSASEYPPAGRRFLRRFAARYGRGRLDAIWGYAAMNLMLDGIARASHGGAQEVTRASVMRAILTTRNHHSVVGTYSINREGDSTLRRYGVYRVQDGRMVFWKSMPG